MIYNQVSSKTVIAKVLSDLDLQEDNIREVDMLEWAVEGLEKIGAFPSFNIKVTGKEGLPLLEVSDYQTRIPADLINIIGVQYSSTESGSFIPLRYGTGTYGIRGDTTDSGETTGIAPTTDIITMAMDLYTWTYEEALLEINSDPILKAKLNSYIVASDSNPRISSFHNDIGVDQYVYYVNNNYIKLNIRSGYLKVAYQAMPVDEEGFPLIPNDPSFLEALYWYINMKLMYVEWRRGSIRDAVYYDARSSWNYYCKQAYGKAMMPNADKLESLKNKWLQFYPEINDFDSTFTNTGLPQLIYNR